MRHVEEDKRKREGAKRGEWEMCESRVREIEIKWEVGESIRKIEEWGEIEM